MGCSPIQAYWFRLSFLRLPLVSTPHTPELLHYLCSFSRLTIEVEFPFFMKILIFSDKLLSSCPDSDLFSTIRIDKIHPIER